MMARSASEKEAILLQVAQYTERNIPLAEAARRVGESVSNIWRWRRAFAENGLDGLATQCAGRSGRRPEVTLNEQELVFTQGLYAQNGSVTTALRILANQDWCRQEVADAILRRRRSGKHNINPTLRAQVAALPEDVITYHQSPKRFGLQSFINPRDLTYLTADGQRREIEPGDLFERDDMTVNFGFWVPWPWGGDPCSDRFGVRLTRGQLLTQIDVRSLYFVSFLLLARLRDSYRADDIWQWIGQGYSDVGMPRIGERWEQGTWAARKLKGDNPVDLGHTPDEERCGGMRGLGLKIITSRKPTTKIIESRFDFLQTAMSAIPGQLGRTRGQMERENRLWTLCRLGHRDPREYFLGFDDACREIEKAFHWVNHEPVEGVLYRGVPAELWQGALDARPLSAVPQEKAYLFARNRHLITENRCHVQVRYTLPDGARAAWWFHHPDLFKHSGAKCAVYMDHYTPAAGATIVVMEGRGAGTVLAGAELVEGCPQFALGVGAPRDGIERRKAHKEAVIAEYRALGIGGRRIARVQHADDGRGGRVERGERAEISRERKPRAEDGDRGRSLVSSGAGRTAQPVDHEPQRNSGRLPSLTPARRAPSEELDDLEAQERAFIEQAGILT